MSRVIYKYTIGSSEVVIPFGLYDRVLCAATQYSNPCVWVEHVVPVEPIAKRIIRVVPTGNGPKPGDQYIGTCHDVGGMGFVLHCYLVKP